MNDFYKISKDSLIELSKRIYEEACGGYMDLRDSACEKFIEDFLADKEDVKKLDDTNLERHEYGARLTNMPSSGVIWSATSASAGEWDGNFGGGIESIMATVTVPDPTLGTTAELVTISNNASIPQMAYNTDVILRNIDQEMLRMRNAPNYYYGNESERM